MPDYAVRLHENDMIVFTNRGIPGKSLDRIEFGGTISAEGYHDARTVAPGWDIYYLEQEWREWITEPPRDVDAAFVGFCRKWYEKRGAPR